MDNIFAFEEWVLYFSEETDLTNKQKRWMSILLAVMTTPYLFLLPTSLLY